MTDARCLIISEESDFNAHALDWGVRRSGRQTCWLRSGGLLDPALDSMAWRFGKDGPARGLGKVAAEAWQSVLFRIHRPPLVDGAARPEDREFVEGEWAALQRSVWALGPQALPALWVNEPESAARAENKCIQLQRIQGCGLRVPETLIGNDPDTILGFIAEHSAVLHKPFLPHAWDVRGRILQTPARRLPKGMQLDPRALALCPGIYQTVVEKQADWRVTVIGERMFAARIQAHENPSEIDWRPTLMSLGRDRCTPGDLPQAVASALQAFMSRLGLAYGAIDLVEDLDGEFWFLEVNPFGQFLFVEHLLPELPLLQNFCAMLLEGRPDYDPEHCKSVSLAEFRTSEAYARFEAAQAA